MPALPQELARHEAASAVATHAHFGPVVAIAVAVAVVHHRATHAHGAGIGTTAAHRGFVGVTKLLYAAHQATADGEHLLDHLGHILALVFGYLYYSHDFDN